MSHTQMSHVAHTNEAYCINFWLLSNESRRTHEWVMSRTWMSLSVMNPCHYLMIAIWHHNWLMSQTPKKPCHTHKWVMLRTRKSLSDRVSIFFDFFFWFFFTPESCCTSSPHLGVRRLSYHNVIVTLLLHCCGVIFCTRVTVCVIVCFQLTKSVCDCVFPTDAHPMIRTHIYTCALPQVHTPTRIHTHAHTHTQNLTSHTHTHKYKRTKTHTHTRAHTHTHTHTDEVRPTEGLCLDLCAYMTSYL